MVNQLKPKYVQTILVMPAQRKPSPSMVAAFRLLNHSERESKARTGKQACNSFIKNFSQHIPDVVYCGIELNNIDASCTSLEFDVLRCEPLKP
jgi:hypothetical protein